MSHISVLGVALHSTRGQQTQSKTACETSGPEDLTCTIGTELYIVAVLYGRTNALPVSTCNPYNKQGMNLNCQQQTTQALDHVKQLCNGKSKCTVTNDYNVLGDPCPGDPKFLKVDYQCIIPTTPPPTTPTAVVNSTVGGSVVTTAASGPIVTSTTPVTTTTAATASTFKTTTLAPNNCMCLITITVLLYSFEICF
ncbi:hypothetical protein DPMN_031635 [Dreissena polymorpha]|uniref:SUEL-type lectin domain-containing protein n=1 Tax=Dreissena polymorpha TaxID=45954 RepID=A0A9D4RJI1_DREPO|nr:hypothetical protein DPMN_031635 [Dreissena polymorpha]